MKIIQLGAEFGYLRSKCTESETVLDFDREMNEELLCMLERDFGGPLQSTPAPRPSLETD